MGKFRKRRGGRRHKTKQLKSYRVSRGGIRL